MNIHDFCGIFVWAMLIGAVAMFAVLLCKVHNQPKRDSSKRIIGTPEGIQGD